MGAKPSFPDNRSRHGERYGGRNAPSRPSAFAAVLGQNGGEEHLTTKLRRAFCEDFDCVVGLPLGQGAILALAFA